MTWDEKLAILAEWPVPPDCQFHACVSPGEGRWSVAVSSCCGVAACHGQLTREPVSRDLVFAWLDDLAMRAREARRRRGCDARPTCAALLRARGEFEAAIGRAASTGETAREPRD